MLTHTNPLAGWTYSRKEAPPWDDDVEPFSPEEQQAILGALSGQAGNTVQFALWTGLRTSELVALDWGDVDWVRGEVMISRAMTQAAGGEAEVTKAAASWRSVKLLRPAQKVLRCKRNTPSWQIERCSRIHARWRRWARDQPITKTMWHPAMKKSGVRYGRPYQTRHMYASMMLSAGVHPIWVTRKMGHSDWLMIGECTDDGRPQQIKAPVTAPN